MTFSLHYMPNTLLTTLWNLSDLIPKGCPPTYCIPSSPMAEVWPVRFWPEALEASGLLALTAFLYLLIKLSTTRTTALRSLPWTISPTNKMLTLAAKWAWCHTHCCFIKGISGSFYSITSVLVFQFNLRNLTRLKRIKSLTIP